MTQETEREAFEAFYFEHWSHGETTPIQHAHKEGCWLAWQTRASLGKREVDVRLLDDAITLITKSLAGMLTDTSFASPYIEDHRPRTPSWVMNHFIHDHDRRVQYVNDIKQSLDWKREFMKKFRANKND